MSGMFVVGGELVEVEFDGKNDAFLVDTDDDSWVATPEQVVDHYTAVSDSAILIEERALKQSSYSEQQHEHTE